jgi:hypothetical protein
VDVDEDSTSEELSTTEDAAQVGPVFICLIKLLMAINSLLQSKDLSDKISSSTTTSSTAAGVGGIMSVAVAWRFPRFAICVSLGGTGLFAAVGVSRIDGARPGGSPQEAGHRLGKMPRTAIRIV